MPPLLLPVGRLQKYLLGRRRFASRLLLALRLVAAAASYRFRRRYAASPASIVTLRFLYARVAFISPIQLARYWRLSASQVMPMMMRD